MGRQDLSVVGGFYKDPNLHWSAQDVLNWIPVPAEKVGTRTRFQFRDAPGLKPFVRITKQVPDGDGFVTVDQGPVRGMRNVEGKLFVVAGNTLYQISNTGVAIPCGTIPGVGRVSMAHNERGNGNQLLVVNGSSGYVYDTVTLVFQKIVDPGYPGAFIADFCDGYLAQVEPQGRFWFHSDLAQALDYNTFDQVEAEADPDRIVGLHVAFREVLIFGADTIQPFVNTGAAQGTFQAAANTLIQCGCSAKFSPRTMDNATFFLDDQRIVRRLQAYNPIRVSTVGIESALAECSREEIASAWGTTFEDRGHKVYYLTVPGRFTFGYDVLSGEWHRRGSPGRGSWRLSEVVFWNGKWIGGDFQSGRLYELDWKYSLDACEELERERITGVLSADQNEITINEAEFLFNTGGPVSTCVAFPEQPDPPTISGEAPDGLQGDAYSFSYTTTPGTAPIARTALIGVTLPDGWSWNESTATISHPTTPIPLATIALTMRVYDTNGLWAEHEDTFQIMQQYFLLVTGSETSVGEPMMAFATALSNPTFTGIPQASGANIATSIPYFHDGAFVTAATDAARVSTDNLATFDTVALDSNGLPPQYLVGGDDGWLSRVAFATSEWSVSPDADGPFVVQTINATFSNAADATSTIQTANIAFRGGDYYFIGYDRNLFRAATAAGPYVAVWDTTKIIDAGQDPNGACIMGWFGGVKVDDRLYCANAWNFNDAARRYQIRWSPDDGETWPEDNRVYDVSNATEGRGPWQMVALDDETIIAYCWGGGVITSANGFAGIVETGLAGVPPGTNPRDTLGGQRIVAVGNLVFVIGWGATDGNKIVWSEDGGLTWSAPVTMPIQQARGIAAGPYVDPAP